MCSRERITPPNKTLAVHAPIETNPEPQKRGQTAVFGELKNYKSAGDVHSR
jgi:hypothetical protein